jgi:uncharacterized protein YjdB
MVTVSAATVPLVRISLEKTTLVLNKGLQETLVVAYNPADTTQQGVAWSSNNSSVATVDATGLVTAVAKGSATITATSTVNTSISENCVVTVQEILLTEISFTSSSMNLAGTGTTGSFTVIYTPADTTERGIIWKSDDAAVATVSGGKVTAVGAGTTTITASSATVPGISKNATVTVTVTPPTGISLASTTLDLIKGQTETLVVTFTPPDATEKGIDWTSSDPSVATVDAAGRVTAIAGGTATITATSTAVSSLTENCAVTVTVPLEGISLDPDPLTLEGLETTGSFTVSYDPPDTTEQGVTWSSNDDSVATVDASGLVTAVAPGNATITATSTVDTTKTTSAEARVVIPLTSLSLSDSTLTLNKGLSQTLTPNYSPGNTTETGVTWSSSDPAVATVAIDGNVTAKSAGTATITATSTANDSISAACSVTVIVPLAGIDIPSTLTLGVGGHYPLPIVFSPADTTQTGITWTSSDSDVATVDANGLVTAVAVGSATITATSTADGSIDESCNVTVKAEYNTAAVNIVFSGFEDETITLDAMVNAGDEIVITAPSGFDRYLWYIDYSSYSPKTSPTLRIYASGFAPGLHYITVIVDEGGNHFSKTVKYTVGY